MMCDSGIIYFYDVIFYLLFEKRSNQSIADILLWDCDDHPENEGGKGLFGMGQGHSKTYLKQLFEDINRCSEYGRDMERQLRENMLD
jgi:hypothetical protein